MDFIDNDCKEVTYVLSLSQDKWYVGKSQSLFNRLSNHFTGKGSAWTQLYRPIAIEDILAFDCEEEATLYYMNLHGVNNVRGHCWSQVELSESSLTSIHKRIDLYFL